MLLVAWGIVKEEKGLGMSLGELLKNVNGVVDLLKKVVGCKPAFSVLPRLEDKTHLAG